MKTSPEKQCIPILPLREGLFTFGHQTDEMFTYSCSATPFSNYISSSGVNDSCYYGTMG
jgi:hypothetical protein